MSKTTVVIYHIADLDGLSSAYLLSKVYPDAKFLGYDYEKTFDVSVLKNKDVIFADVHFDDDDLMLQVIEDSNSTMVFDHHKTFNDFINYYVASNKQTSKFNYVPVDPEDTFSAVALIYKYLHPDMPLPEWINYISMFDTWHHNYDPKILAFQLYVNFKAENYKAEIFKQLDSDSNKINEAIEEGLKLQEYTDKMAEKLVKHHAYVMEFEGVTFLAMNIPTKGSLQFKDHPLRKVIPAQLIYSKKPNGFWKISMYCDKDANIDLSVIATKYGGGGHATACGFEALTLPFK